MRAIWIAPLLLVGCAQPAWSYRVAIDPDISAEHQQLAVAAADEWTSRQPKLTLDMHIGSCDASMRRPYICVGEAPPPLAHAELGAGAVTAENVNHVGAEQLALVTLDAEHPWTAETYQHAVAHELGHAFGLPHNGAGTVMWHDDGPEASMTVTAQDAKALAYR